ncbi:MAG: KilA-N domain-containing protein [Saprospiraceae bacterium]|nr:KilA-N domain-containing protein [Saprospiraceae bacterium]
MNQRTTSLHVEGTSIRLNDNFISLTDMCKHFPRGTNLLSDWLRNRNTLEYIKTWEQLNNPDFKTSEFAGFENQAGLNTFHVYAGDLVETCSVRCLQVSKGRYGGTYAVLEVAFHFAMWLSPKFHLLVVGQYLQLLEEKYGSEAIQWKVRRELSKVNYHIHTDAVKQAMPPRLGIMEQGFRYANEADLLNLALFGTIAAQWRLENPALPGNIRDHATTEQLLILANLENLNAEYLKNGLDSSERLRILNERAIEQMDLLLRYDAGKKIQQVESNDLKK